MEQVDSLVQSGDRNVQGEYTKGEQLLQDCLSLKDQLDLGFVEMQRKLGFPWSYPNQKPFWSELDQSIPQDIFPNAIEYPSISCAETHLMWWTTCILLYPLIDHLLIFLNQSRSNLRLTLWDVPASFDQVISCVTLADKLPENLTGVAEHYANLICRSAIVQPQVKAWGLKNCLLPSVKQPSSTTVKVPTINIDDARKCSCAFHSLALE
jgi:hypothetical protein